MTMRALALALALALVALPVLAEETIAAVQVNGKTVDAAALLSPTEDGDLLLDATTWAAWGVTLPPSTPKGLVSARKLGIQVVFDGPSQSYRLTVPASLLPAQTFQRRGSSAAPAAPNSSSPTRRSGRSSSSGSRLSRALVNAFQAPHRLSSGGPPGQRTLTRSRSASSRTTTWP